MTDLINLMAHLDCVDHLIHTAVLKHREERRRKMILTSDQERIIEALSFLGGGWAEVKPDGKFAHVTLAGDQGEFWVLPDGHTRTRDKEGPGDQLASKIYAGEDGSHLLKYGW